MKSTVGEQDRTKQAALDFGRVLSVLVCFGSQDRYSQEVANSDDMFDESC